MKLVLFLFLFTFSLQAQILTFNPFSNKLFSWDGMTFSNTQNQTERYTVFFSDSPNTFQAPVALSSNEFVVSSNKGELFIIDLETKSSELFFASEDGCRQDLGFSGCIYSLLITSQKEILYLLHQRNGSDSLMKGKDQLVQNIPGPSGPIWIRPNGNLGLLPFGHGIYEIAIPVELRQFSEVLISETPIETMAGIVLEGIQSSEMVKTYIFDFSSLKMLQNENQFVTFAQSYNVALDPCFGHAWFVDGQTIETLSVSPNPAACPLTLRWNIENKSSKKGSKISEASRFWDFPKGTEMIPNSYVFSLGYRGQLTLVPSLVINDSDGTDIRIFENAFAAYGSGKIFIEAAQVEIFDGNRWISTGCDCNSPDATLCAGMQTTTVMPGDGTPVWGQEAGGFGIDLADLEIASLHKLRLIDCGTAGDSGATGGFDLDAISINPNSLGI